MVKLIISMAVALTLGIPRGVPDVLNEPLAEEVDFGEIKDSGETESSGVEILEKYSSLYKENTDMAGYIYLPNGIGYPIMYTPYNQNYYINHDFNKAGSREGLPFLNRYSLLGLQGISLMYGHNLKSGRGFTVLKKYLDKEYFDENKYIQADTLYNVQEYEVVAVALTSLNDPFSYYEYVGDLNQRDFETWKMGFEDYVVRGSLSELTCEDKVLELSTCYYHKDDGRLVVILKAK